MKQSIWSTEGKEEHLLNRQEGKCKAIMSKAEEEEGEGEENEIPKLDIPHLRPTHHQ